MGITGNSATDAAIAGALAGPFNSAVAKVAGLIGVAPNTTAQATVNRPPVQGGAVTPANPTAGTRVERFAFLRKPIVWVGLAAVIVVGAVAFLSRRRRR